MKVIAKPIKMVAWFDESGKLRPVKFQVEIDDEQTVIKVDRVIKQDLEKLAGNNMLLFTCESEIDGLKRLYEIKYELNSCRWMLFKI
jgi:hypothetical protein